MQDDLDQALQVDVLAAALKMENKEAGDLLEFLAQKLQAALPQSTEVTRGGWILSKDKPVKELLVRFDDFQYQITRGRHGSFTAREMKVVRGVVLKTAEIQLDQWINNVASQLSELANRNREARQALNKFLMP